MKDPHKPPSREEVEASGAADWVQQAMDKHAAKQDQLASVFGDTKAELRKQKDSLAAAWDAAAAQEKDEDRGPDLFANERARVEKQKRELSSVWDQDRADREAEEAQLRNLFGGGPPKKNPPKKGR